MHICENRFIEDHTVLFYCCLFYKKLRSQIPKLSTYHMYLRPILKQLRVTAYYIFFENPA